jgi:hypothetical protein
MGLLRKSWRLSLKFRRGVRDVIGWPLMAWQARGPRGVRHVGTAELTPLAWVSGFYEPYMYVLID